MNLIETMTNNLAIINIGLSTMILVATIAYVWINTQMHREMVRSRVRSERPRVDLRIEKKLSGFYDLAIENTSENAVFDLTFDEFPAVSLVDGTTEMEAGVLSRGVKYMAPHQIYKTLFINYPRAVRENRHREILRFALRYRDRSGRWYADEFLINLSLFFNLTELDTNVEGRVIDHLRDMRASLKQIAQALPPQADRPKQW